jgi:RNA polymerase sigma-70 factor (ECF subfamily)
MVQPTDRDAAGDAAFERDLIALIPNARAFARTLTGNAAEADDLAQEAVVKGWTSRSSFQPGTNMKAWIFMILRNQFLSEKRRSWRSTQLDPEVAERSLVANDDPSATLELNELRQALNHLPLVQREALVLVGAGGLSYLEAAAVCDCAVGTMKSRVSRARVALAALLEHGDFPRDRSLPGDAAGAIVADVEQLRSRS